MKFVLTFTQEDAQRTVGRLKVNSDSRARKLVRILAIVASSALPILSIVALYYIRSQIARLGTIVAFSVLCSIILAAMSDSSNLEIIATTAA